MDNLFGGNLYVPGSQTQMWIKELVKAIIGSDEFKKEMSNSIRVEMEANRHKYSKESNSNNLSYEMLTRGNVNMQAKMAANGYDVYGKTIISSNMPNDNGNLYKKMKNKINYGSPAPKDGYENRGQQSVF